MSLKTEAETIRDLCDEIIAFEMERNLLVKNEGTAYLHDNPKMAVLLTANQKQTLLAQEVTLQQQIKSISGTWAV